MEELKERKKEKRDIKSLLNPEQTPVLLFVSFDRKHRFKCKTDLQVFPVHWDFTRQQLKWQAPGAQAFNQRLGNLLRDVQGEYNHLMNENSLISFEEIRMNIQEFVSDNQAPKFNDENSFFLVYDEFIRRKKNELSHRTIQKFETSKNLLKKYTERYYRRFTFETIDLDFIDAYKHYLQYEAKNQKSEESGFRDDTVAKYIENLKNFLKWSYERRKHSNTIFQHSEFRAKRDSNLDIVTLSLQELRTLYNKDLSEHESLERVRDIFCFGAFTGQRWSDISAFKKEDLDSDTWIFKAYKTKKETIIPLVGYAAPALDILKKYDYKLPEISNQKFNDYIKLAAEKAELNRTVKITRYQGTQKIEIVKPLHKAISSHMARRTCVSILLNIYKMPVNQVMEITGHTDYKTLKRYIDEDKQALRQNLEQTKSINEVLKVVKSA
ncbi:tyrosine-type recombinase/integrase [Maribellus comscasis]|nr:site-specific integrase [Maribellus comscasis]